MTDFLSTDAFRKAAKGKRKPPAGTSVFRVSTAAAEIGPEGSRIIRYVFSDGSIDRSSDTIDPDGWETASFEANPVALWAHNSSEPPIGRASNLAVENSALKGDIDFASAEIYPFADTIYRLAKGGFINAVSVGFLPLEWAFVEDKDRGFGIDYKRQELLEISIVPVPCNANALTEARAKGIDTRPLVEWAEKVLDGGGRIILPKSEVERLRKQATEPKRSPARKDDGGSMNETDPTSGGALVGTCGRKADAECGMSNPAECSVHGPLTDEDKEMADLLARTVRTALRAELKKLGIKAEGDDESPSIAKALGHFKAAADAYDEGDEHHENGIKALKSLVGDADNDGKAAEDDDKEDKEDEDDAAEKAARRKRLAALLSK